MKVIVDTNVPVVANSRSAKHASSTCIRFCIHTLLDIQQQHTLILDDRWRILKEYQRNLNSTGEPGIGDSFLKWALDNRTNPSHCELVPITPLPNSVDGNDFAEFPADPALANFDRADRKFVAIALAHSEKPPILNATDTDWWNHHIILEKQGVQITFLCPDAMP